jgi:hypothetical protein
MHEVREFGRTLGFGLLVVAIFIAAPAWWISTQPELAAAISAWVRDTAEAGARWVR